MALELTYPLIDGHEVHLDSTTHTDRVLISCSCGKVMDIPEGPSGAALMKAISAITGHYEELGATPLSKEQVQKVMKHAETFDRIFPPEEEQHGSTD